MSMTVEATSELGSIINQSGVPTADIVKYGQTEANPYIGEGASMREVATALSRWVDNARAATGRTGMFDRGTFTPPDNPYEEMRTARAAMKYDSIVAGVAEVTESFAFQGVKWEGDDADEADVFNQLSRDMNLDALIRAMWREEYTYGQFVAAKLWGWRDYTVRGRTKNGNKRKRTFRIWAPLQIRLLDSAKVVPVGLGPLGGERLAWQATQGEIGAYQMAYSGETIDPLMLAFFQGTYQPGFEENAELAALGVNTSRLLAMNPEFVFRHTLTKPDYARFADIRLKSCFALLDLKRQLMNSDRAALIGAANYILLIRKGDKDNPAQQEELTNLKENYNFIAKLPVIISDHRLQIDIIAPKTDTTLTGEKYDNIDSRLLARLLGTLSLGGKGQRNETQETISVAVGRVMENRRHMLKRTIELEIGRAIVEHPRNAGVFETEPNLVYSPRNIALSMDQAYVTGLLALRTQRELSRETILEFFGLDEATEAQRMEMEAEIYDDIFKTEIPYSKGAPEADIDTNLDKSDKSASSALALTAGPDGTLKIAPSAPAKKAPAKAPAKKAVPAKATPNGTPESPKVSGARGGRPAAGSPPKKSPGVPRTPKKGT